MTPFATKLPAPSAVPELIALTKLDTAQASAAIAREVTESVFRPADIAQAKIDEPSFFYVPFWRVSVSVDGFHVGVTTIRTEGSAFPIPTGGARSASAAIMVPARSTLPYAAALPSKLAALSSTAPVELDLHELVSLSGLPTPLRADERVDADVTRDLAERIATGLLRQSVQPHSAIYAKYETLVQDAACVYYPVFHAAYRYEGDVSQRPGEDFFVLLSGRTGKPMASKHPSAARAVAAKFRKLLSFDW